MHKLNVLKTLCAAGLLFSGSLIHAANITHINRYATVDNKPSAAQINPLLAVQHMHFPQHITTVGEALTYWLRYSGYTLANEKLRCTALKEVLQKPLPQVHRHLGPLTIQDGLGVLVGKQVFSLESSHLHRVVNFKLMSQGYSA